MAKITKKVITLYGCDMSGSDFKSTYVCDADKLDDTLLAIQFQCTEYYDYEIADGWEYDDEELKTLAEYAKERNSEYLSAR
jgi:hypothetical protein